MKFIKKFENLNNSEILDKIADFFKKIINTEYKHSVIRDDDYLILSFGSGGYLCKFKNNKITYYGKDVMNHFYPHLLEYLEMKIPVIYKYKFDFDKVEDLTLSKEEYEALVAANKYNI